MRNLLPRSPVCAQGCRDCRLCLPLPPLGSTAPALPRCCQELQRDGAATSHSLFSLQLIFLKYRSQSFPETLEQGSPVTHFVVGSWMWHCSKSSTSSVLPGLTPGSEIPGTQLRAWLFQESVFINIYPVQRESQLVLNQ